MRVPELLSKGIAFQKAGKAKQAERFYRRVLADSPKDFEALYLLGIARSQQGDFDEAIRLFERAVAVDGTSAAVFLNLGITRKLAGRYAEAIEAIERSIRLKPSTPAYAGLGDCYRALKQWQKAAQCYSSAIGLKPDDAATIAALIEAKRTLCDWSALDAITLSLERLLQRRETVHPFVLLNIFDDPTLHLANARAFTARRYFSSPKRPAPPKTSGKIRVGYFSADFREHAVAYLTARLFELHDRNRFEVVAVSFGPGDESPTRKRLKSAFDRFLDVSRLKSGEILPALRDLRLDIAVDLHGHTNGSRLDLFANRVAPVQATYLGYPGSTGAEFFDYAIVDRFVAPEPSHFSERLIYLPNCYQPNDDKRPIGVAPSRADAGLPDDAFVFCCFNAPHKITPAIFGAWTTMLKAVPGSVLWLMQGSDEATSNLRTHADKSGIDPSRLIFARMVAPAEHLARHRIADLFLDTSPYGAHTEASDALWAGLPVLTCAGSAFASRVAGSLLNSVGLAEMITTSLADYETLGVQLAREPERLAATRSRLAENLGTAPLFDSSGHCRAIERAFQAMWSRHCQTRTPESFSV